MTDLAKTIAQIRDAPTRRRVDREVHRALIKHKERDEIIAIANAAALRREYLASPEYKLKLARTL